MVSQLLETVQRYSLWPQRRTRALEGLQQSLSVESDAIARMHDWNAVPLAQYLSGGPLSFYFEPAFTDYYRYLIRRYGGELPPGMEPVSKLGLVLPIDQPCSFAEA